MTDEIPRQIADVYRGNVLAGKITRTVKGSVFEYDELYLEAADPRGGIAYNLSHSQRRHETFGVNLHTFFAGLLPEGLRLEALTRGIKTSRDDLLSILIACGTDCIGDVSVVPEGEALKELAPDIDVRNLDKSSFAELFRKSISYENANEKSFDEITLPGIQDKISANLISFPVKAKRKNRAYILKLNPPDKPRLVENENFFLTMAGGCGIDTAGAKIVTDRDGRSGLLVERFDRNFISPVAPPEKAHQEDACQFLDRYPADKYTQVSCRMIAEGIERFCTAPVIEIAKFIKLVAFSYLIANGDLHAKNVSICTSRATGRTALTPAYDLLSTLPYGDNRMAIKFEGRDDNLRRSDFVGFGGRHGIRKHAIESILDQLYEESSGRVERIGEIGFSDKVTKYLIMTMQRRREDLVK